jgi:hypothetical protein
MNAVMSAIVLIIQNIFSMILGPKMAIFILKKLAKRSDNLIDDNAVLLIEGGYEKDHEKVKKAIEGLIEEINKKNI